MNELISSQFKMLEATRRNILRVVENTSLEDLNRIPDNFSNNLIWNAAHVIATQQILMYKLSNNSCSVKDNFIDEFRKGTKSKNSLENSDIERIKQLLLQTVQKARKDFEAGLFKSFKAYSTSYNIDLTNIEDAIFFNNIHEGLHLGYMMSMRRQIP